MLFKVFATLEFVLQGACKVTNVLGGCGLRKAKRLVKIEQRNLDNVRLFHSQWCSTRAWDELACGSWRCGRRRNTFGTCRSWSTWGICSGSRRSGTPCRCCIWPGAWPPPPLPGDGAPEATRDSAVHAAASRGSAVARWICPGCHRWPPARCQPAPGRISLRALCWSHRKRLLHLVGGVPKNIKWCFIFL